MNHPQHDLGNWDLGLDISTSYVGWSLLSQDGSEMLLGYIPLVKLKGLFCKATEVRKCLLELDLKYRINRVFVEEDLQKFRRGFSSAKVIQTLTRFNGMVCLVAYDIFFHEPESINVNAARKAVGCKIDRKDKTRTTKEKVFAWVQGEIDYDWPTKILKGGPNKGKVRRVDGCYDMADAYVICRAGRELSQQVLAV